MRTRRYDWNKCMVSLRWRKSLSQSKIQTGQGRGTFLTCLFTDSSNVLKPGLLLVCQQRTEQTQLCSPHLSLQTPTLSRPFLFHSFALWGWGKLKFRSHSEPSCRAVVVALIKSPNWNKSQPAEALQPRLHWLHGEKEKKDLSSYFSLHWTILERFRSLKTFLCKLQLKYPEQKQLLFLEQHDCA